MLLENWRYDICVHQKIELGIIHRAGIKHQAGDTLSRLRTNGWEKTSLDDEVTVNTIPQEIFACPPKTETNNIERIEQQKGLFVLFLMEVCMMARITGNDNEELSMLAEFI